MRLLFDQNLSRRLVSVLSGLYPDSTHVSLVGLDTATDREIWDFAAAQDYVIVSKDSDFRQLAFLLGGPPKTVWLRVGNVSTDVIAVLLANHVNDIAAFVDDDEEALLVLPGLDG